MCCDNESEHGVKSSYAARGCSILNRTPLWTVIGMRDLNTGRKVRQQPRIYYLDNQ